MSRLLFSSEERADPQPVLTLAVGDCEFSDECVNTLQAHPNGAVSGPNEEAVGAFLLVQVPDEGGLCRLQRFDVRHHILIQPFEHLSFFMETTVDDTPTANQCGDREVHLCFLGEVDYVSAIQRIRNP